MFLLTAITGLYQTINKQDFGLTSYEIAQLSYNGVGLLWSQWCESFCADISSKKS